jgi:hypothetical protein
MTPDGATKFRWDQVAVGPGPGFRSRPEPRHRCSMVYDSQQGYSILFGGQAASGELLGDTWAYSGGCWRQWQMKTGQGPSPRCGHALVFDESLQAVVLFGGIDNNDQPLGDTWVFDGRSWRQVLRESPPRRRYAAFAYSPLMQGSVLHERAIFRGCMRRFRWV